MSLFQAPGAMSRSARSDNSARAIVAAALCAAFVWALVISVSPQLHARIHTDANRSEHTCAVTLIATGSYDYAAHPPLVAQPRFTEEFSEVAALISTWVPPIFLGAHVFAHAPPLFA